MPGLRIYYVPPRLAGTVANWSGLDSPDGASWLLNRVEDLKFNAIWFSPLQVTSQVEKIHDGKTVKGSLYAIRNHFALDREFSAEPGMQKRSSYGAEQLARIDADNKRHLQHFTAQAAERGIKVFADLVFNHVAADHPLVLEENKKIEVILEKGCNILPIYKDNEVIGIFWRDGHGGEMHVSHFKFKRNADYTLTVGGPCDDPWSDVAQINYNSPEARRFFVTGDREHKGYWKQVIDWHMDMGFKAFRCDVAYMVPPDCWKEIVTYARKTEPEAVFLAETLGGDHPTVEKMAQAKIDDGKGGGRPVFDLGMLSTYWWNFKDKWLPDDEHLRIQKMAQYGGAGFPDNHDTPETLAGHFNKAFVGMADKEEAVAALCLRNYAVAALVCNSHYMQMGFELCKETQNRVFKGAGSPEEWQDLVQGREGKSPLDISEGVRMINAIKETLDVSKTRIVFHGNQPLKKEAMIKIHCSYVDIETGEPKAEIVLLLNTQPEKGPVQADLEKAFGGNDYKGFERSSVTGSVSVDVRHVSIDDVVILHRKGGTVPRSLASRATPRPAL